MNMIVIHKVAQHEFDKWEYAPVITGYTDVYTDSLYVYDLPIKKDRWTRKCKHCGYIQSVTLEPDELKEERSSGLVLSRKWHQ